MIYIDYKENTKKPKAKRPIKKAEMKEPLKETETKKVPKESGTKKDKKDMLIDIDQISEQPKTKAKPEAKKEKKSKVKTANEKKAEKKKGDDKLMSDLKKARKKAKKRMKKAVDMMVELASTDVSELVLQEVHTNKVSRKEAKASVREYLETLKGYIEFEGDGAKTGFESFNDDDRDWSILIINQKLRDLETI